MRDKGIGTKIRDILVEDVAYVTVPGNREEVIRVFKERSVSGAPVVKDRKVVGIVTREDLLKNPYEEQIALLMKRHPITISPESSIKDAAKLLVSHGIRRLPVVVDGKLIGIVTAADVAKVMANLDYKEPIGNYMEDVIPAIWDEVPLYVAGRLMELARVRAIPVLNSELELVGIITDRDLIHAAVIEEKMEHSDLSLSSDDDAWKWKSMKDTLKLFYSVSKLKLPAKLVKDVMVKDVVTVTKSSTISECASKMSKNKFDQLPVVSAKDKLVGMVIARDLLKVFL